VRKPLRLPSAAWTRTAYEKTAAMKDSRYIALVYKRQLLLLLLLLTVC